MRQPPDHEAPDYFSIACPDDPFQKHLTICTNSGFTLYNDTVTRHLRIMDGANGVLHAVPFGGILGLWIACKIRVVQKKYDSGNKFGKKT